MISLKKHNTYNINSFAKNVYYPKNIIDIINIFANNKNVLIIGNGSNIILSKYIYEDITFIVLADNFAKVDFYNDCIVAQSGALLTSLSCLAFKLSLSGLEIFYDIPASVGGAIVMNAGAYGDEIYNYVVSVTVLDINTLEIIELQKHEINYGYRYSDFKNGKYCILSVKFKLKYSSHDIIKQKMIQIYTKRLLNLPKQPSAGSVFMRPDYNISVGEMVEKINLKGFCVGGAQISLKHGGIIVNSNNAVGQDIITIIDKIKYEILIHYNVKLKAEQIII